LNQAIRIDGGYGLAYNNRGVAQQRKGNLDEAVADFTLALTLNRRNSTAYVNRGLAYLRLGRPAEAEMDFQKALALNPNLKSFIDKGVAATKAERRQ
jgi:Flp pilus assembly protein TadD